MGTFNVEIEIGDPDGRRFERVDALVDSRATYTVIPSALLADLGVKPHRTMTFELADGSLIERGFGRVWVRLDGGEEVSPVIFGDNDDAPLMGKVTLSTFCLEIDEANERLVAVMARL